MNNKWISASTPPKQMGNVLVTDGRHIAIGCYYPRQDQWEHVAFLGTIKYWMLLPRPPEVEML